MMKIDFHAHIVPMADHGCADAETARAQLTLARRAGVEVIVATPHFYPQRHTPEQFLARQVRGVREWETIWEKTFPRVLLGAEVLLLPGLDRMEQLESFCIQGTERVILLELPMQGVNEETWATITRIRRRGFHPVLAHLNRCTPEIVARALREGLDFQLNAEAFLRVFSRKRWVALAKECCALGSDIHGAPPNGYHAFEKAVRVLREEADPLMNRTKVVLNL